MNSSTAASNGTSDSPLDPGRAAWLQTLTAPMIVFYVDPDEAEEEGISPSQHVLQTIDLGEGEIITPNTRVELQPEYGSTFWTTASELHPAPRITLDISIDLDLTPGFGETISSIIDTIKGNFTSAISQGLLTEDTASTAESHSVEVKLVEVQSLLNDERRQELRQKLVRHWIEAVLNSQYVEQIANNGFVGYQYLTDDELLQEHNDVFGEPFLREQDA